MSSTNELEARVRAAWAQVGDYFERREVGEASPADDPQPQLARELFDAWLANPEASHANKALTTAFRMWGNAGLAAEVDRALPLLDVSAPYWGAVLRAAYRAYLKAGRGRDRFVERLRTYEDTLTHDRSRSALFEMLGMNYWFMGDLDRARMYYSHVVALAVDPAFIGRAQGALYEFDNLQPGQPAPLFEGETITGETFRLLDQRGKGVLIDFWSTDCGPCWPEMPFLRQIREDYPESKLTLIGVSYDQRLDELIRVVDAEHLRWPHIREQHVKIDDRFEVGPIAKLYNVQMIPRAVLIDADGSIVSNNRRGTALLDAVREMIES